MSSIDSTGVCFVDISAAHARKIVRLTAVALAAASLAACAQSSVVSQRSEVRASRQASVRARSNAIVGEDTRGGHEEAYAVRFTQRCETTCLAGDRQLLQRGIRRPRAAKNSITRELTAAHPSLPFGTKLRVTDVNTGRSVTVRVNDRGPYVPGRIVDVSHSAAAELGMIGKGVTNVRLDVVQ